jgi:hypothetical protein
MADVPRACFGSGQVIAVFSLGSEYNLCCGERIRQGTYLVGSTDHSRNSGCIGYGCDLS